MLFLGLRGGLTSWNLHQIGPGATRSSRGLIFTLTVSEDQAQESQTLSGRSGQVATAGAATAVESLRAVRRAFMDLLFNPIWE